MGTLKGVGRIYQQTFVDTYSKVAFAKLYDTKTPLTAADLINDRVVPFFETHGIPLSRVLTDRGTEYCGAPGAPRARAVPRDREHRPHADEGEEPADERDLRAVPRDVLNEFYRVAFRKKLYTSLVELQADLDAWLTVYNEQRAHQGRWCYGKTPMQTFLDSVPLAKERMLAA